MFNADQIKSSIENALPGSIVQVQDSTGEGNHFQVLVVSDQFADKSRVEQHQMVYHALQEEIEGELHAVGLKTYTPEAWKKAQG